MMFDALTISLLTLAGIRFFGMLIFIHLYHQKKEKKYILLASGWLLITAGSAWALHTHVASGAMDHFFSSLFAGLGTLWILFGTLFYFSKIQWRYIYVCSFMIIVYGSLPLLGLSLGPSPGVLVQFFISLILMFIAIFKRKIFINYAQSSYFWLILLTVFTNALTLAFFLGIIQNMAIGFAGTSIVALVAIIFFLHLEYNLSARSKQLSEQKYSSMIKNLMEGFYSVSFDGILLDYNMEFVRILNLDPKADQHGIKLPEFWQNPADRKIYQDELIKSGAIRNYEINVITATGKAITVLASARLVNNEQDNSMRIDGCFLDITSRKNATDELNELKSKLEEIVEKRTAELREKVDKLHKSEKAMLYMVEDLNQLTTELQKEKVKLQFSNKELEAFSYSVSHDLRAPLRAIDGYSQMLIEKYHAKLDEEAIRFLNVIRGSTHKMDHLISSLLEMAKVTRYAMKKENIEMNIVIKSVISDLQDIIDKSKISIILDPLPTAIGNSVLIRQVWTNLIDNAIKFTKSKEIKEIEIKGSIDNQQVVYQIADTGIGFNPSYSNKLFKPFYTLHSLKEFPENTGMGLALVERIIQRHGGKVWAEGIEGVGATFYFSLPTKD